MPVATVTMTGARCGRERSLPLVCFHDGEKRVLIASNLGAKTNPAWYYNLLANPQMLLSEEGNQAKYTARQALPAEREKYWRDAVESYPGYKDYQERAGDRLIPVMVLEPDRTSG
jgi:deazaflavin-dependent oxidoreductase (nitroreductase family)